MDLNANIRIVLSHIEAQNVKWLQLEQSHGRRQDLREAEDPRIDLCIFCIGPHRWVGGGMGRTCTLPRTRTLICAFGG